MFILALTWDNKKGISITRIVISIILIAGFILLWFILK